MTSNHIIINMGTKYKKENKITPLYTINVEVILHYITWKQNIRKKTK